MDTIKTDAVPVDTDDNLAARPNTPTITRTGGRFQESSLWSDARHVQRLKDMWAAGISSREIGLALGVSKNVVLYKVARLGLPPRGSATSIEVRARQVDAANRNWCHPNGVQRLTELWAAGLSASRIAAELGTTKNAVLGKVHRLRLPGRGSASQPRKPSEMNKPLTAWSDPEKVNALKTLWEQGLPVRVIAAQLGVSRHAVLNKAKRLDLPRRGASSLEAVSQEAPSPQTLDREAPSQEAANEQAPSPQTLDREAPGSQDRGVDGDVATLDTPAIEENEAPAPILPPPPTPSAARSTTGCRWPMWDDQERPTHVYCGAPVSRAWPGLYCEAHRARAFTRVAAMARAASAANATKDA